MFFTVYVTVTLPFGRVAAGVNVTDGTVRSGRTTLSTPVVSRSLFASSASSTAPALSAVTRMRYRPGVVSAGIRTVLGPGTLRPGPALTAVRVGPIGTSAPVGTPEA